LKACRVKKCDVTVGSRCKLFYHDAYGTRYKEDEVGKTAFLHKVEITLTDDSHIDTAHAVYSEMSDEGYKKCEFAVTASASNIFDGGMIRFGSGDCLSFWFHIEFINLDNESDNID